MGVGDAATLYLDEIEGGWGWGTFDAWGIVSGYHYEQLEIHHVIGHTLCAIDEGGAG